MKNCIRRFSKTNFFGQIRQEKEIKDGLYNLFVQDLPFFILPLVKPALQEFARAERVLLGNYN
jgi:hypothetical protein